MTPDQLSVQIHGSGDRISVTIIGSLDHATAGSFRDAVLPLPDTGLAAVIVDVAGLEFCDSTGLSALVHLHLAGRERGVAVRFSRPNARLVSRLTMTGLINLLEIDSDDGDASMVG